MNNSLPYSAPLPPRAGVDVSKVEREAAAVRAALDDLADDEGWMVSRDDSLRVLYKHQVGVREMRD